MLRYWICLKRAKTIHSIFFFIVYSLMGHSSQWWMNKCAFFDKAKITNIIRLFLTALNSPRFRIHHQTFLLLNSCALIKLFIFHIQPPLLSLFQKKKKKSVFYKSHPWEEARSILQTTSFSLSLFFLFNSFFFSNQKPQSTSAKKSKCNNGFKVPVISQHMLI